MLLLLLNDASVKAPTAVNHPLFLLAALMHVSLPVVAYDCRHRRFLHAAAADTAAVTTTDAADATTAVTAAVAAATASDAPFKPPLSASGSAVCGPCAAGRSAAGKWEDEDSS